MNMRDDFHLRGTAGPHSSEGERLNIINLLSIQSSSPWMNNRRCAAVNCTRPSKSEGEVMPRKVMTLGGGAGGGGGALACRSQFDNYSWFVMLCLVGFWLIRGVMAPAHSLASAFKRSRYSITRIEVTFARRRNDRWKSLGGLMSTATPLKIPDAFPKSYRRRCLLSWPGSFHSCQGRLPFDTDAGDLVFV